MEKFDVVIIGASFAGSCLASLLKSDLKVLVIDRKKNIEATVDTTGLITENTKKYIESKIGNIDKCLTNDIYTLGVVSPNFSDYFVSKTDKPWIYTTNPNQIIKIAQQKSGDNCKFRYECEMENLNNINGKWVIDIKGGEKIETKYVIGADGAMSQVGIKTQGIDTNSKFLIGFEKVFKGKILKETHGNDIFHFWFGELALGYGGWISPDVIDGEDVVRIGMAIHKDQAHQQVKLKDFIENLIKHGWIEAGEEVDYFADLIPVGGAVQNPIRNNACVIGDAAGICGPFAADGIRGAFASAVAISKHINKGQRLNTAEFYLDIEKETKLISYIKKQLTYRWIWELMLSNNSFHALYELCKSIEVDFLNNYIESKENKGSLTKKLIKLSNVSKLWKLGWSTLKDNL